MTTDQRPRAALTAGEMRELRTICDQRFHLDPQTAIAIIRALDELEQLRREEAALVTALGERDIREIVLVAEMREAINLEPLKDAYKRLFHVAASYVAAHDARATETERHRDT